MMNTENVFEEWRLIPGWPYEASSLGRIRRSERGQGTRAGYVLKPKAHSYGYPMVDLSKDNQVTRFQVGRLVCLAFHGNPIVAQHRALHGNGNPKDNHPGNLRWGTQTENVADARFHGTIARGETHGQAKMAEDTVRLMRQLKAEGMTNTALAKRFGISHGVTSSICNFKAWVHVK